MKSRTDLNQLKSTAKSLLYIDISETELSPMIVKHPYTDSGIVGINNDKGYEIANILENNDALMQWQDIMRERIENAKSAIEIYCLITKPYKLAFLKFAAQSLSSVDFSEILADAWISSEAPNNDANLNQKNLLSMFKSANPFVLMNKKELEVFNNLDDEVTIYRGVTSYNSDNIKALSWTLDYDKAEWFANRFGEEGTVYEAEIEKSHILAYFGRRNESEVIVDPKYLMDIEETEALSNGMSMT